MRQSAAAVALIRRQNDGQTLWLAQWNPRWQKYHFVSGHKRPDETFLQCMVRELGEELGLEEGTGFRVAAEPLAHLEYTAWSESAGAETRYTLELFEVELVGAVAQQRVDADPANRWLTREEIRLERCEDGKPVSPTMARLLPKAGLTA
jgi:8-oxo-dGTP pyrophosphatase MutT (NUDIX family)